MATADETSTSPPSSGFRASLALLRRNRDFRKLFYAQLISNAGDWFLTVALFELVLEGSGNTEMLAGFVVVVQMMPFFLVSPLGGVLADRLDRRKLMIATDLVRATVIAVFLFFDAANVVVLAIGLQAIESALAGFFDPASNAAIPNIVEPEDLLLANAVLGSTWGTMLAVGAAIGGVVAAVFGREAAYLGDAVSFVISAALLATITRSFSEEKAVREGRPRVFLDVAESIRYARTDPRVPALIAVKAGFGLAGGIGLVLLPILSEQAFAGGAIGIGILMGARGVGALTGPFIGRALAGDTQRGLFRAIGIALFTFGVVYLFLPLAPSLLVAALCAAGAHLGGGAQWALSSYGLQKIVPDYVRGRIFAMDVALITFTLSISALLAAGAAALWGPSVAVLVLAGISLAFATAWWLLTTRFRRGDAAA